MIQPTAFFGGRAPLGLIVYTRKQEAHIFFLFSLGARFSFNISSISEEVGPLQLESSVLGENQLLVYN